MSERSDSALRPPDPAGTQPKVDPRSLESERREDRSQLAITAGTPAPSLPEAGPATFLSAPTAQAPEPETTALGRPREPPAMQHPDAPRFQFLFGALAALGVCAIGLAVLLLSAPKAAAPKPWSAWRPGDNGVDPAQQIAAQVAPDYRLDNGKQIVQVSGGPPALQGQPMAIGESRSGQEAARLEGNSVLYQMCGGGHNCSIKEGKPSVQRALLLSREALELALYTFRYVGGVSQVIVTIPPAPSATTPTKHALMFRSEDVAAELGHPLSYTLSAETPRVSQMNRSVDTPIVKQLTGTKLYDYVAEAVPQGGAVMVLSPPTS